MAITFIGHKLQYTVDTEADIDTSWEQGSVIWCSTSNKMYMMLTGGAYEWVSPTQAYNAGTLYQGVFPYFASAAVSGGNAIFYLTDNGLSSGNAVFKNNVFTNSLNLTISSVTAQYQYGIPTVASGNKSISIPVTQIALSLGIIIFTAAANGTTILLQIWGN